MRINSALCLALLIALAPAMAGADDLTQMVQQDLVTLGYDPGGTDGQMSTPTIVAISKFQAENGQDPRDALRRHRRSGQSG